MVTAFGILIVGDDRRAGGLRFIRLSLTGSLAGSLSEGAGVDSPTLAAIGQMGNIWSGGGTLARVVLAARRRRVRPGAGGRAGAALFHPGRLGPGGLHRARGVDLRLARQFRTTAAPDRLSGPGCSCGGMSVGRGGARRAGPGRGLDLVADRPDRLHALAGRVLELPVQVALPGKIGQASPQPMVITTSEASTASVVSTLGCSAEMSMPTSAIASTAAG